MAVVMSYDKDGVVRVQDMSLDTPLIFLRDDTDLLDWETRTEVASKTQSWETVNGTTGAITGSNAVTP
jgi:hypothetical protein